MGYTKVFISGSPDDLEAEREIAIRTIISLHLEPIIYDGFVQSPANTIGHLPIVEEVKESDIVTLLLWKTLPIQIRYEYQTAISARKPLLVYVKMLKGTESRDQDLSDFLEELKKQSQSNAVPGLQIQSYQEFRGLADIERCLEKSITTEIHRQLKHTVITAQTRQEMYQLGTRISSAARQRLFIVQKTAILLLGARDYDSPDNLKVWYEAEYLNSLEQWIKMCCTDPTRRCVYLYDAEGTRKEIESFNLQDLAIKNMRKYKEYERKSSQRFRFTPISSKYSGPMTVGDSWFAFWVTGEYDAVTISFIHDQVADEVVKVMTSLASKSYSEEQQSIEIGLI